MPKIQSNPLEKFMYMFKNLQARIGNNAMKIVDMQRIAIDHYELPGDRS